MSRTLAEESPGLFPIERGNWLRLRTLVILRWLALGGQVAAILAASLWFGVRLPVAPSALVLATAVLANLVCMIFYPENRRLSQEEAFLNLLFDLLQLALLLFVTGGLNNPFALLMLAPTMISASALGLRPTTALAGLTILLVVLLSIYHIPLHGADGRILELPPLFSFGFALAIAIGVLFMGLFSRRIAQEMRLMSDALLATQHALAREQKLTDLGGVIAAAAHELGTPLATIKLAASELLDQTRDNPDLAEDARLIRDQADRCRDILRSMGKAGKSDELVKSAPLSALLREAAEPHLQRGKAVVFRGLAAPGEAEEEPAVLRKPELIHGLRNLIQNAVDFARSRVEIEGALQGDTLILRIADDGIGFPAKLMGRIGDPFLRRRSDETEAPDARRPAYEGMGLGLFIAKTLLERTGASLAFSNDQSPFLKPAEQPGLGGAVVEVLWPLAAIRAESAGSLGPNHPIA